MLVPGILGFQGLVYAVLLLGFLAIRQAWRNAEAKKEEITGFVEGAVVAEMDAVAADYSFSSSIPSSSFDSVSVPRWYQCAVCDAPTTMRCSQCKSVRYCSGKCQIIHWRHGHKDECCPPVAGQLREDSVSEVSTSEMQSALNGNVANPSVAARKSFDDGYHSRLAKSVRDGTADEMCSASAHTNETVLNPSFSVEPENSANIELEDSDAIKRMNSGIREHRRKVATVDKSSKNTSNSIKVPSSNNSCTDCVADSDLLEESHQAKHKEARRSSFSSGDRLSLATKGNVVSHSKSAKTDNYHTLPAKVSAIPNLPQNVRNGLKMSMQKVVQQFRGSKESRSNLTSIEDKMGFPYEFFLELYCYDKVKLFPFGLTNCGNSCYANAVLQCLAYTRPLTSYLFQGFHSKQCQKKGWCFICEFEYLIQKAKEGNSPLSPIGILSKIHKIGSHLGHGREEDAHEFLRCAVDTMQSICLKEAGISSPLAEETTLIGYTFGGYLRSKIKCLRCLGKSERYERMMDLTVEIDGDIGTLEEALGQFTAPEILDKDNKYNCSRCKSYEKARKKLTVLEAPNILTIVLKRFQSGSFEKLNKSVQFPEVLDVAPFMSGTKDKSPLYSLYAVVVHLDIMNAAFSGHYLCYVKNVQGQWFRTDDSQVEPVELSRVLSERAYMLLYARHCPKPLASLSSNATSSAGKLTRRSLEAIPATSKSRLNSVSASAESSSLQQKHDKHPLRSSVDDPLSNEFAYPEDWRFHYGGRNTMVDSSSESSSLFSSSDVSSCSTASIKDSASSDDFSEYIFGEVGPNWYNNYGLSSNSVASSSYDNIASDFLVDSDDSKRLWQESELEDKAVLYANKNKNHSGSKGFDLKRFVTTNRYDKNSGVHVRRTSRDASAQMF